MNSRALNLSEGGDGNCITAIMEKAKRNGGQINYQELADCFSSMGFDEESQQEIIETLEDMGTKISG